MTFWLSNWFVNVDLLLINVIYFGAYLQLLSLKSTNVLFKVS